MATAKRGGKSKTLFHHFVMLVGFVKVIFVQTGDGRKIGDIDSVELGV